MWIDDRFGTYWRRKSSWWEKQIADGQWLREIPTNPLRHLDTGMDVAPSVTVSSRSPYLVMTQASYDVLMVKDPKTLYVIIG